MAYFWIKAIELQPGPGTNPIPWCVMWEVSVEHPSGQKEKLGVMSTLVNAQHFKVQRVL